MSAKIFLALNGMETGWITPPGTIYDCDRPQLCPYVQKSGGVTL